MSEEASHFLGTVITHYPKPTETNGSVEVVLRYKQNFHTCSSSIAWFCLNGPCGVSPPVTLQYVDQEINGAEWCQHEGIMTRQLPGNAPFELQIDSNAWISGIVNNIVSWRAVTLVDLRNRSDTGRANISPQTTMIPAIRVPRNCLRVFNLLAFDPDGDEVKCRYGILTTECNPCTPASVLSLSSSCTLTFSPTNSSVGPYAVQLMMEDFPRETITLTQTGGATVAKNTSDAISKIPLQFVFRVDDVVPSCQEGVYLPKYEPPTPADGARLFTLAGQTLDIVIKATVTTAYSSVELLYSGPHNAIQTNQTTAAAIQYSLKWTPSQSEDGESHPFCFVVQVVSSAVGSTRTFHSELRCVIVTVGNETTPTTTPTTTIITHDPFSTPTTLTTTPGLPTPHYVVRMRAKISSSSSSSEEVKKLVLQKIKEKLVDSGFPSNITLSISRFEQV